MTSKTYIPMAPANSVPRIHRRYKYVHFPQPSDSVELMEELRRGLRAVPKGGFWSKVKSFAWHFMSELSVLFLCSVDGDIDETPKDGGIEPPILRPDFPVAPPSSPVPRTRRMAPDIHIYPAGSPDYLLSPPPPQEDGFLYVPARMSRSTRPRRRERLPPSPRPLPTPPGPPASPIPKILCCPWANSPSTSSSSSSSSENPEKTPEEIEEARFFAEIMPFLFLPDEDSSDDDDESKGPDTPGSSTVALSSDKVPPAPQAEEDVMAKSSAQTEEDDLAMGSAQTEEDDMVMGSAQTEEDELAMSSAQTEAIRETAVDREFLEELGLTPQTFMALLDGVDVEWDEDSDEEDED